MCEIYYIVIMSFRTDIKSTPFYFIMANYFYKDFDLVYHPAELAFGKFTFKDGINCYHTFVNPGKFKA